MAERQITLAVMRDILGDQGWRLDMTCWPYGMVKIVPMSISVQREDFDVGRELAALTARAGDSGAVASFIGRVRRDDQVLAMTLEHYPGMTEKALQAIVDEAGRRWPLNAVRIIHRVGRLLPGENIVLVLVAAGHRRAAFAACEFLIDYLKTRAPFWKREETRHGSRWVAAKTEDELAAERWAQP